MSLEGKLKGRALPRVLQSLAAQHLSGILTVQGEDDIVAVSLLEGAIVSADALNQTVEDGLGEALQGQKLISAEDFSATVRDHEGGSSSSLGDLLVERGLVSRKELLEGLRRQTLDLMLQILAWSTGEFKFYGGDEVSFEEGLESISVEELLIRSIDELGEQAAMTGPVPDLESTYRQIPQRTKTQVIGREGDGTGAGIWISPEQEALLLKVSGHTTGTALARELGLNRYQVQFALLKLLRHGLIEPLGLPKASPGPLELPTPSGKSAEPLRAEIFTPPEPSGTSLAPEVTDPTGAATGLGQLQRWANPALAAVLALALVLALFVNPGSFMLPFPWQDKQRIAVQRQLRQSLYLKIDRAAKTYFLVEVHYPGALEDLAERNLVSRFDLRDQAGNPLSYSTDDLSYRIVPVVDGQKDPDSSTTEAITGDFLLDPQYLRPPPSDVQPLYLIE